MPCIIEVIFLQFMYPLVIRKKILAVKERDKLTLEQVDKRFDVHPRTILRWKKRINPKLKRNKPATKIDINLLGRDAEENPDSFQYERVKRFNVSPDTISLCFT